MVTLYTIHADDVPVYLPLDLRGNTSYEDEEVTPTSANLVMEDNKSGSLEFSILPANKAYDEIELIVSTIKVKEYVYEDDGSLHSETILWKGRPISVEEDMDGIRTFTCEGALAFLNDIICYPITNAIVSEVVTPSSGITTAKAMRNEAMRLALSDYLDYGGNQDPQMKKMKNGALFSNSQVSTQEFKDCIYTVGHGYNEMCKSNRKFRVGKVTIGNNRGLVGFIDGTEPENEWYPSDDYPSGVWSFKGELTTPTAAFASALDQILDITVDLNGGHLRVRHEEVNGTEHMYLDYLGDFMDADASAEYGVNIIEFDGKLELNSPVTDIIPRGATISTWNGNETVDTVDTSKFQIGNTVKFKGNYHYVASTSDQGYKCTPGEARITNINFNGKHPIHLIHTGNDSTVYGWVNQSDVETSSKKTDTEFVQRHYESYPYTEYIGVYSSKYGVHVINENLVEKYGHIQQIVDFSDISDKNELLEAAKEWLDAHSSFLKQSYEVSLVDLGHVYGTDDVPIHLLDRVHVSMSNHDIDEYMPVTKIELNLLNPADTTISFSKEISRAASVMLMSARTATVDPAVELNQPNDSISQAMARNIRYISDTSAHAVINTSVSQNSKVTLPDGKTANIEVVMDVDHGTWTEKQVTKMTFVNGLLCSTGNSGGPEYDFFGTEEYIRGPGILRPTKPYMQVLYEADDNVINPNYYAYDLLFGSDYGTHGKVPKYSAENPYGDYYSENYISVYRYPYYFTDDDQEADSLFLDYDRSSDGYGLYYRLVNGVKKYFASPCIYYLPSGYTGDLYVFYAGPIANTSSDINSGNNYVVFTTKTSNLGTTTGGGEASTLLKNMFNDVFIPKLNNNLKRLFNQKNRPTYTETTDTVITGGSIFKRAPCTALLIMPMHIVTFAGNYGGSTIDQLYVCPVLIQQMGKSSDSVTINGIRREKEIKIYTGRYGKVLPRDYKRGTEAQLASYMPDMYLKTAKYKKSEIATEITKAKYYVFSTEEDLNAVVEEYKSGAYTQDEIEQRNKSKIIALHNGSATNESFSKMQLAYKFDGTITMYNVNGTVYDPFYGS